MAKKSGKYEVTSREDAQRVIAELLCKFTGNTAKNRMRSHARFSKQSDEEAAWRAAGNLLTSFDVVRPLGS